MDGLLIDSERITMAAWLDAARLCGHQMSAGDYIATIGLDAAATYTILSQRLGGALPHVAAKAGDLLRGAEFPLKPGAKELLISLQSAGVVCAVASSSSAQEVEIRLARAGILHFIAGYAGGDEVEQGKPDPAVYMLAAERIGIAPFCCLAFEDSHNGALSALAAGMQVALVPDLVMPSSDVVAQCFGVLGSLDDAIQNIPKWFRVAD